MLRKLLIVILLLAALVVLFAFQSSNVSIRKRERFTFDNTDCIATNTCDLSKISYLVEDYQVAMIDGRLNFGTRLHAEYETDSVSSLENYVFVQFIRGCVFSSKDDGTIALSYAQPSGRNEFEAMNYPDWTLDSYDSDPVYNSMPGYTKHHYYRWNDSRIPFNNDAHYYGIEKPSFPNLYVTDRPGTAFLESEDRAKNISLEFKMCLYRSDSVPEKMGLGDKELAEPIYCYRWASSWIYNHQNEKYENPDGISDICQK